MWNKYCIVFDNHVIYITNDTQKHFKETTLKYAERVHAMYDLYWYLLHYSKKGED